MAFTTLSDTAVNCFEPRENAASRWALLVVRAIDSPLDPRTLTLWGRFVGASVATLRSRCAAIGISTKSSLDFARLLRAIVASRDSRWRPALELDVHDPRTLHRLLARGGIAGLRGGTASPSIGLFLEHQRLVQHELALRSIADELSNRGLL